MNFPYMKEVLIGCIGLNVAFFFLGAALGDPRLMGLAMLSGASCGLGIIVRNKMEKGE